MPRYKVNMRFGPWRVGEEFDSNDERYAMLAEQGKLLTEIGPWPPEPAPRDDPPAGAQEPEQQSLTGVLWPRPTDSAGEDES
jgi:hypothetical protein